MWRMRDERKSVVDNGDWEGLGVRVRVAEAGRDRWYMCRR